MKTRGRPHINSQGRECHCPWGEGQIGEEHVGHVHTASKLEWLEKRPDMQDEKGQAFLKLLKGELQQNSEHGHVRADKLLPWLVREWKKGRIAPAAQYPYRLKYNPEGHPLTLDEEDLVGDVLPTPKRITTGENGENRLQSLTTITPDDSRAAVKAMDDMKKYRKGIDAMQHKTHEFFPKVQDFMKWQRDQERPDYGEVVHKFPDDWSVRRLQNRAEALAEGEEMGHCVGSHHAPYIDDGRQLILSLRDHNNAPHATIQLEPDHYAHEKTGDTISKDDWRKLYYGEMDPETLKRGPGDIEKAMKYKPMVGPTSTTEQFYGKEDSAPKQEYTDRINEWLDQHGLYAEPSEGEEEEEEFEPWWSDEYGSEGVDNPRDYIGYDMYDYAPDEYNQARAEADEHGLEGPSLYMDPDYPHDHHNILAGLTNATGRWWDHGTPIDLTGGYSPELGQAVVDKAANPYNYDEDEEQFSEALRDHHSELNDTINWPELEAMHPDEARNEFTKEYGQDPNWQMIQHLGPQLWDQQEWQDKNFLNQFKPPIHPSQQMLFTPGETVGGGWGEPTNWNQHSYTGEQLPEGDVADPRQHGEFFSKTGSALPPLYYRWAFSPDTGVSLSSNEDDHPARVPYHQDLAGKSGKDRQHGYAYRIHGGWRLTDWEHGDVKDPYIVSQVVQALRTQEGPKDESEKPSREAFARLHYGLPL
jgi:hypothetical protein